MSCSASWDRERLACKGYGNASGGFGLCSGERRSYRTAIHDADCFDLELAIADPADYLPQVQNAGAIFLGPHSGEVMGDYVAGPSHVLPTYGTARFSSPLGVYDFEKRSSVIELSARGVQPLAQTAATLAHGEGFEAHARAAELRLKDIDHNI